MGASAVVVRRVYDALTEGNLPTVLGAFDGKIEWREAEGFLYADGNPYIGPEAVATGVLQRAVADVEQFEVVPTTFIDAGDTIVVEGQRLRPPFSEVELAIVT